MATVPVCPPQAVDGLVLVFPTGQEATATDALTDSTLLVCSACQTHSAPTLLAMLTERTLLSFPSCPLPFLLTNIVLQMQ